ncbi:exonuclease domain-containing protein [Micrococcoides hystricis]|uniref:Exonuclease domain-containing protein n=1 Tax=Micrococcoides hystricis TaxID=1572761 RepID=A0ABV6PBX1_9MICC
MSVRFVAIDFETANSFRGSACSVGLSRVENGVVTERAHWLMRPPAGYDVFDPRNVSIHRITEADVAHAPRFAELFGNIMNFVGHDPLVAHNANFDVGVIRSGAEVSELAVPAFHYACSLQLARRNYELASYALPNAAAAAGWEITDHHNAQADADACAAIVVDICKSVQAPDLGTALARSEIALKLSPEYVPGETVFSKATRDAMATEGIYDAARNVAARALPGPQWDLWPQEGTNPEPNRNADPEHPLFGQHIVFTGGLHISRQEAKNLAAECGAQTGNRVINKTTILVIGDGFDPRDLLRGEPTLSTGTKKAQMVLERRAAGQQIEIFSEAQFFQALSGNWPEEGALSASFATTGAASR